MCNIHTQTDTLSWTLLVLQVLCEGNLVGLNCRLRCYRYDAGNVYRPHVDGAWPGSGVKEGKVGVSHSRSRSMLSAYECMMRSLSLQLARQWCDGGQGGCESQQELFYVERV